jgi:hypothetical protein
MQKNFDSEGLEEILTKKEYLVGMFPTGLEPGSLG